MTARKGEKRQPRRLPIDTGYPAWFVQNNKRKKVPLSDAIIIDLGNDNELEIMLRPPYPGGDGFLSLCATGLLVVAPAGGNRVHVFVEPLTRAPKRLPR